MEAKYYFPFDNPEDNAQECKQAVRQYRQYLQALVTTREELTRFADKQITKRLTNSLNKHLEEKGNMFRTYIKNTTTWDELHFYIKGEDESKLCYFGFIEIHFVGNTGKLFKAGTDDNINANAKHTLQSIQDLIKAQKGYNKEVAKFHKVMQAIREYNETRNKAISPYIFPQISRK